MKEAAEPISEPGVKALEYATPASEGQVPAFVPEVDGRIDAGRSIRHVGRLFPSFLVAALYVQGVYTRRLQAIRDTECVVCGRPTDDRIGIVWLHPVPWPLPRDLFSLAVIHRNLVASHPCCKGCGPALRRPARVASRWRMLVGLSGVTAFLAWYLLTVHTLMRGREKLVVALAPLLIIVSVAVSWVGLTRWARRQLPKRLTGAVPRGLRFERFTDQLTARSVVEKAVNAARAMNDLIELRSEPLDTAAAIAAVCDPAAGGVDVFLGTTRGEVREGDRVELVALDYEAYGEMAVAQMRELVSRARERWPIVRCVILHRTGRVALAEASVVIAVSCPHRVAAFEACRFLIDELKKSVTIWKKEVWADGSVSWIHPETGVVTVEG